MSMDQAATSQSWRKVLDWSGTRTIRRQAPAGRPLEGLGAKYANGRLELRGSKVDFL